MRRTRADAQAPSQTRESSPARAHGGVPGKARDSCVRHPHSALSCNCTALLTDALAVARVAVARGGGMDSG